jgi:hypothetical protein
LSAPSIPALKVAAEHAIEQAADSRVVEILARLGYVSRGLVHLVIGGLAVRLAMGEVGGKTVSSPEAVSELAHGGRTPLLVVAVGLVGYGIWRFAQALADTERKGRKLGGIIGRIGQFVNGVLHLALAPVAFKLAMGIKTDTRDHTKHYVAQVMAKPFGRVAVAIVGVILIVSFCSQLRESIRAKFAKDFDGADMRPIGRRAAVVIGRVGIGMRAFTFGAMGAWLLSAAWHLDPHEAKGLGEALGALRQQPYGSILFTAIAFGILAYALFCFIYAQFRRIGTQ